MLRALRVGRRTRGHLLRERYGSGASNSFADTFAFQAIAAAVVGGTSIFGGARAVWRAVVGVLILALIGNGFNLLGIDPTYQLAVQGVLIFAAVAGTSPSGAGSRSA